MDAPICAPPGAEGKADAKGKFEFQLMPGSYQLPVTPPLTLNPPDREEGGPTLAWSRKYYPGVFRRDAASNILTLPDAEVADMRGGRAIVHVAATDAQGTVCAVHKRSRIAGRPIEDYVRAR